MKVCIVGAGAVGGLIGTRLAVTGVAVSALDRRGFDELLEKAETTLFAEGQSEKAEALHAAVNES